MGLDDDGEGVGRELALIDVLLDELVLQEAVQDTDGVDVLAH